MSLHRSVFLSAYLGMLLFGISLITLGSVAPGLKEKFSLDAVAFGTLFSILPFGILSGSLFFGPLADRYGFKIIFLLAGLSTFIGFEGIAYAESLTILKASVFLFGFGGGVLNGASNAVVSDISESDKGANLSFLGVFFALGALGMPFILGILEKKFPFDTIVAGVGYLALLGVALFLATRFPVAKQAHGISLKEVRNLLNDSFLLLVGFFLLCQSSFEAIINNWTTTYLLNKISISMSNALYALSLYVLGMAITRIILGKILKRVSSKSILLMSMALLVIACVLIQFGTSFSLSAIGLVILGAGLAAGYPVMLGFVGDRYKTLSGTAFSIVISMALVGSMIINYLMGLIVERFGIQHLITVGFVLTTGMLFFMLMVFNKIKS
jgi:MFS transporter, FHS family, glucose/mannose:H+ symporter